MLIAAYLGKVIVELCSFMLLLLFFSEPTSCTIVEIVICQELRKTGKVLYFLVERER